LFPLAVGAVYWKRTTATGAIACIAVTAVTWAVLFYRDVIAAKPPGADELLIAGMMPVTLIVAASAITLVVVSLLTPKPSEVTLRKFFP
jgi:SSS family solute:Na+ symporter